MMIQILNTAKLRYLDEYDINDNVERLSVDAKTGSVISTQIMDGDRLSVEDESDLFQAEVNGQALKSNAKSEDMTIQIYDLQKNRYLTSDELYVNDKTHLSVCVEQGLVLRSHVKHGRLIVDDDDRYEARIEGTFIREYFKL